MSCVAPYIAQRSPTTGEVRIVGNARVHSFRAFEFPIPCGTCVACLRERAKSHAVRCMHEREVSERACFVTLTYDEEHLPYGESLVKEHFQKFVRALRKKMRCRIRFFGCGEYGERSGRPHYHALLFGVDFSSDRVVVSKRAGFVVYRSATLDGVWKYGRCEIGSATFASAGYIAGYVAKKMGADVLAESGREKEFLLMSLKPAIGVPWLEANWRHVYARDSVVVDGVEVRPPRRYDLWMASRHPGRFGEVQAARSEGRVSAACDPELREQRLSQVDEVFTARVNLFAREMD